MPSRINLTRPRSLRRFARFVTVDSGLHDPPVISGLIDLTNEYTWRHRR